jgi:hypothetical protein
MGLSSISITRVLGWICPSHSEAVNTPRPCFRYPRLSFRRQGVGNFDALDGILIRVCRSASLCSS